jgi:methylisocitrate lyase
MIFPEALTTLEEYAWFTQASHVPVLANITEFGRTPLFTRNELRDVGVGLILYPLSAFRAMSMAALEVYTAILKEGTQASVIEMMQTREALYDVLNYHHYEDILDREREREDDE